MRLTQKVSPRCVITRGDGSLIRVALATSWLGHAQSSSRMLSKDGEMGRADTLGLMSAWWLLNWLSAMACPKVRLIALPGSMGTGSSREASLGSTLIGSEHV